VSKPKLTTEQYDQLLDEFRKYNPQRRGQHIMNKLYDIAPDVHAKIQSTSADPYYNDQALALFWLFLERSYVETQAIPTADDETVVLVVGNLSEGYRICGPFEDFEAAAKYSDSVDTDTWVASLESPEQFAHRCQTDES
jgi:hypothetical protein